MTDIVEVIRDFDMAYPEDVFPYPDEKTRVEVRNLYPGFTDGISASMGRHIAKKIQPAADELETLRQRVKELENAQAGFMHLSDMRQAMIDTADENQELRQRVKELERDVEYWATTVRRELIEHYEKELAELRKAQGEPVAWIEHHKAGDNLTWEREDHSYAKATPLYTSPPAIPEGWQLVPIEPTEEMMDACDSVQIWKTYDGGKFYMDWSMADAAYKALLSAAPKP